MNNQFQFQHVSQNTLMLSSILNPVRDTLFAPPPPPPPQNKEPSTYSIGNGGDQSSHKSQNQNFNTWQNEPLVMNVNSNSSGEPYGNGLNTQLPTVLPALTNTIPPHNSAGNSWPLYSANDCIDSYNKFGHTIQNVPQTTSSINYSSINASNNQSNMQHNMWNSQVQNNSIGYSNTGNYNSNNTMQPNIVIGQNINDSLNKSSSAGHMTTWNGNNNSWGNSCIEIRSASENDDQGGQISNINSNVSNNSGSCQNDGERQNSYNQTGYISTGFNRGNSQAMGNISNNLSYTNDRQNSVPNQKEFTGRGCAYELCRNGIADGDFHIYCLNHRACFANGQLIPCQSCERTFTTLLNRFEPLDPIYNVWSGIIKRLRMRRVEILGNENIWRNENDERNFTLPCEVFARARCSSTGCDLAILNGDLHIHCLSHRFCVDEYDQLTPCEYCVATFKNVIVLGKMHLFNAWTFMIRNLENIRRTNFNMTDIWRYSEDLKFFNFDELLAIEKYVVRIKEPIPLYTSKEDSKSKGDQSLHICVDNLNFETTDQKLESYFSQFGDVINAYTVKIGTNGTNRGYGYVTFGKADMALAAVRHYPHELDGSSIVTRLKDTNPDDTHTPTDDGQTISVLSSNTCSKGKCEVKICFGDEHKECIKHRSCITKEFQIKPCEKCLGNFENMVSGVCQSNSDMWNTVILFLEKQRKISYNDCNIWVDSVDEEYYAKMSQSGSTLKNFVKKIIVEEKMCEFCRCKTRVAAGDLHTYCLNHRNCFKDGLFIPCEICEKTFANISTNTSHFHPMYNVWNNMISLIKVRRKRLYGDDNIWKSVEDEKRFEFHINKPKEHTFCQFTNCDLAITSGDLHPFCDKHRTCFRDGKLIPCKYCEITINSLLHSMETNNAWTTIVSRLKKKRKDIFYDENIWLSDADERLFTLPSQMISAGSPNDSSSVNSGDFSVYDLFGPDMMISTEDLDEAVVPLFSRAWEKKKCMVVCDPAYDSLLDTSTLPSTAVANLTILIKHEIMKCDKDVKVDMKVITKNVCLDLMHNEDIDYLVVIPFLSDFTKLSESNQICFVDNDQNFEKLFRAVIKLVDSWKAAKPSIQILWALPYALDFERINSKQCNGDDDLKTSLCEESRIFYKKMELFFIEWKRRLPGIPCINLSDVFFEKSESDMMSTKSIPIFWPDGYTIDGLSPTNELCEKIWGQIYTEFFKIFRNKFFTGKRMISSNKTIIKIPRENYCPKSEEEEIEHGWLSEKICLIGDATVANLVNVRRLKLPNIDLIIRDLSSQPFSQFINDVDGILLENVYDMLVLSPFHEKTVIKYTPQNKDKNSEGLVLQKPRPIDMTVALPAISKATEKWRNAYPIMKVVWLLPLPINFLLKNCINISTYDELSGGLGGTGLYAVNAKKENYHSVIYYIKVVNLIRKWLVNLPNVATLSLVDLYLTNEQMDSFIDAKEKISWSVGYTWNGVDVLPKFANLFWENLEELRNNMEDPSFIGMRHERMNKEMSKNDIDEEDLNHPLYSFMWERFWKAHSKTLRSVQIDPESYDFSMEWSYKWHSYGQSFTKIHHSLSLAELRSPELMFRFNSFVKKQVVELEKEGKEINSLDLKQNWDLAEKKRSQFSERDRLEMERLEKERLEKLEKERLENHRKKRVSEIENRRLIQVGRKSLKLVQNDEKERLTEEKGKWLEVEIIEERRPSLDERIATISNEINDNLEEVIDIEDAPPWNAIDVEVQATLKSEQKKKTISNISQSTADSVEAELKSNSDINKKNLLASCYSPIKALSLLSEFVNHFSYLAPSVIKLNRQASKKREDKTPMVIFEDSFNITVLQVSLVLLDDIFLQNNDPQMNAKAVTCIEALHELLVEIGAPNVSKESSEVLETGMLPGQDKPIRRKNVERRVSGKKILKSGRRDSKDGFDDFEEQLKTNCPFPSKRNVRWQDEEDSSPEAELGQYGRGNGSIKRNETWLEENENHSDSNVHLEKPSNKSMQQKQPDNHSYFPPFDRENKDNFQPSHQPETPHLTTREQLQNDPPKAQILSQPQLSPIAPLLAPTIPLQIAPLDERLCSQISLETLVKENVFSGGYGTSKPLSQNKVNNYQCESSIASKNVFPADGRPSFSSQIASQTFNQSLNLAKKENIFSTNYDSSNELEASLKRPLNRIDNERFDSMPKNAKFECIGDEPRNRFSHDDDDDDKGNGRGFFCHIGENSQMYENIDRRIPNTVPLQHHSINSPLINISKNNDNVHVVKNRPHVPDGGKDSPFSSFKIPVDPKNGRLETKPRLVENENECDQSVADCGKNKVEDSSHGIPQRLLSKMDPVEQAQLTKYLKMLEGTVSDLQKAVDEKKKRKKVVQNNS